MWIETVFVPWPASPRAWAVAAALVFQGAALWLGAMSGLLPAPSRVPLLR